MCYMNWEVLLAMCIWDFTCVGNCSECVSCQTLKSFQLEIERRKVVTTSGISKMPNIYIQSVKSILPTHELSTSNGQKTMSQMAHSLLSIGRKTYKVVYSLYSFQNQSP